jgi:hypothetical protein
MLSTSSARHVAARIYAEEVGETAGDEEAIGAAKRIHAKLGSALAPVLGGTGFNAVFARSVQKATRAYPCLEEVVSTDSDTFLERLWACLTKQAPADTPEIVSGILGRFLALLSTFIGDELTFRLLGITWLEAADIKAGSAEKP